MMLFGLMIFIFGAGLLVNGESYEGGSNTLFEI